MPAEPDQVDAELANGPRGRRPYSERPGMVLLMLFAVLGPLALPMLWRSGRFSVFWKVVLTVLVTLITVLIVWILWYVVSQLIEAIRELQTLHEAAY
jgi:xanthine/uracil/vitamin C permease (AzgA family)